MIPFDAKGFVSAAGSVLKPWRKNHVTAGSFDSFDHTRICYYKAARPDAGSVIVMVHGFCEFFGKYHETAFNFWEHGYTVYFIELRGHGGSGRSVEEKDIVDVSDFSEYVEDLKCFLDKVVLPENPGLMIRTDLSRRDRKTQDGDRADRPSQGQKLLLFAHSMGGCVGTLFLERNPEYFISAVLSSPMLKMTFGEVPMWQVKLMLLASKVRGWNEELMPGMKKFDPDNPDFEGSGTSSRERFDYQFRLRTDPESDRNNTMNAATWNWGRAAMKATQDAAMEMEKITIPILLCQAGKDVYVDNEGQNELARRAKHVKLVRFADSEHEIYASDPVTMKKYFKELFRFFDKASKL